jgi:hypothetical protein
MLKMTHPEIEAVGQVLDREQFNTLYAPRGWTLLDEPASYANDQLGRFVRSVDDLTNDEARALIAVRGGDYPDEKASGTEVQELYVQSFEPVAQETPVTESPTGVPLKLYDPADYTAQEVLDHLGTVDEAEAARILAAEAAPGAKNRVTIANWTPPSSDETAPAANENQE